MIKNNDYCFFFFEDYFSQLQTKIPQEHAKAQLALRAGKKSEAQLCLTKRKLMENEVRLVTKLTKCEVCQNATSEVCNKETSTVKCET